MGDSFFVPPQDLEAERCVLGSMLCDQRAIDEVTPIVEVDHFYADANRKLFLAIREMHERGIRGIDAVTLRNEMEKRGQLDDVGGQNYIIAVIATVPHAAHAEYYANIVRSKYVLRSVIESCTDSIREARDGNDESEEILARAEHRLFEIVERQSGTAKIKLKDILEDTFSRIFDRMGADGQRGVPSGFDSLDKILTGFHPSELIILAARPSMGKTALVCNLALAVARANRGVLVFSLEQSKLELGERLLCIEAQISGHKLRLGELSEQEQFALTEAAESLRGYSILIDDQPGQTMTRIAAISRRTKRSDDIGLIVIDYLQLIESEDRHIPREQQISSITRRLKCLAKSLSVPVIALGQLNRAVESREDKKPKLSDLRESGAIEQDADVVMFLHRPDAYEPENRPGEADLIVAKNRSGPTGLAGLVWQKHAMKFADRGYFEN
ncbi:replicative DNA helicase [Planctomyces sp. SH-PL14]|uniref:replicative DNA helicase n=1 Tax=Planctomyces sp. SH-PL14 TaxID=1632864 RepID=UPI00078D0EFA|nr:replicative DNA helicase [Planctomyces sp. SH-PL14]AMV20451.1 Replicative DNA helicase [Planctomyces sp. SH-PL14]